MSELLNGQAGERRLLLGNEAIVRGALEAGVSLAATYPGTPASEIGDRFYEVSRQTDLIFEYSVNEKVALEVAAGASAAGWRTMASMKHVGLNVAADALITLGYVGVKGGMVIISADDPSLFSSQNEQDNRYYARMAGLPLLEPASPQEAKDMTRAAFALSEELGLPVLLRTTTRVNHTRGPVTLGELALRPGLGHFLKDPNASWASYTNSSKTCDSTFCHRQGNRSLGSAQDNLSIGWDCTVDLGCKTCHGSQPGSKSGYTVFGSSKAGEPNYDNGAFSGGDNTLNSHYKHMKLPGANDTTFCYKCHGSTVDNLVAGKLKGAGHLNDNVEVVAGAGSGVSFTWNPGTHTCGDISCHGGTGASAKWGADLNCSACHSSMGAGPGSAAYTGTHRTHTDNTTYRYACEQCHAASTVNRGSHPIVTHGNGDYNAASAGRYVE